MRVTFWRRFWIDFWELVFPSRVACCYRCRGPACFGQWNDGPLMGEKVCWNPKGCKPR